MTYDTSGNLLAPDGNSPNPIVVDPSTYQVDVYFASATTFIVVINGGVGPQVPTARTAQTAATARLRLSLSVRSRLGRLAPVW
jgi:hypothetical protein